MSAESHNNWRNQQKDRRVRIKQRYKVLGSLSKLAREFRISRQRAHQIIHSKT